MPTPEDSSPLDWTPQMCLDEARKECDCNNPPDAMLIILAWDMKGDYRTMLLNCGLETKAEEVDLLGHVITRRRQ